MIVRRVEENDSLTGTNDEGTWWVEEIENYHSRHRAQDSHELDEDIPEDEWYTDNGVLADYLWGSDAMYEWAQDLIDDVEGLSQKLGSEDTLTVMTWNIKQEDVTDQVELFRPDILGLQEATELDTMSTVEVPDEATFGQQIPLYYDSDRVTDPETSFTELETDSNVDGTRAMLTADFGDVFVMNTHLDSGSDSANHDFARQIVDRLEDVDADTTILLGDMNTPPDLKAYDILTDEIDDTMGESHFGPEDTQGNERIDYVFSDADVAMTITLVTDASDHDPFVAELNI